MVAQSFETSDEVTCGTDGVAFVEVIITQIPVGSIGLEHLKSDDEDLVLY